MCVSVNRKTVKKMNPCESQREVIVCVRGVQYDISGKKSLKNWRNEKLILEVPTAFMKYEI